MHLARLAGSSTIPRDRLRASSTRVYEREKKMAQGLVAYLFSTLTLDSDKDATLGPIRRVAFHWQIRTTKDAENDLSVHDQRQTHRILSTTQKSLCPIDGIQRPSPYRQTTSTYTRRERSATHVRCDHLDHSHGRSRPTTLQEYVPGPDRVPTQRSPPSPGPP